MIKYNRKEQSKDMKYVAISIMCICHYLAQVVIVLGIWRTSAPDVIKIVVTLLALLNSISFNTERDE